MEVKMSLLENAFDFLDAAADNLLESEITSRNLKYAILHLSSAVELLLKQKLANEHWSLIFSKDANKDKLEEGDFQSVSLEEAITRLKNICDLDLETHAKIIRALKKERNKIEHYAVEIAELQAKSYIIKTWGFILYFVDEYLPEEKQKNIEQFREIVSKLTEIREFIDQRLEEIQPEIDKLKEHHILCLDCPQCLQRCLPVTDDGKTCLLCRTTFTWKDFPNEWISKFDWRTRDSISDIDLTIHQCPQCECEYLYPLSKQDGYDMEWICLACGVSYNFGALSYCGRCGEPYEYTPGEDATICYSCLRD